MKLKLFPHTAIFAAVCLASAPFLHAAAPVLSQGDLLMGFRVTGSPGTGTSYVVNIGKGSTYRDATSTITITNINSDLVTQFGGLGDWKTRMDLSWGVAGSPNINGSYSGDPEDTIYISKSQSSENVPGTGFTITSPTNRGTAASKILSMIGYDSAASQNIQGGFDEGAATAANDRGILQDEAFANAWRRYMAPGGDLATNNIDFGAFSNIEALPTKTLSLFRMSDGSAATYLGYFKIESNGDVTYTPVPTAVSYNTWAAANVSGHTANLDDDGDGLDNGTEWFMGTDPNSFTRNPPITSGTITWPRATGNAAAASVKVQTSTDLTSWSDTVTGLESGSGPVVYAVPSGHPKFFVRLSVTP